jgi:aminopeptidase-like protein
MRTKYEAYPEYHTSLDDLSLISSEGLEGAFNVLQRCVLTLERNRRYRASVPGEPQLGKRGLYPAVSFRGSAAGVDTMMNVLAFADGTSDLLDIAETIGSDMMECAEAAERLERLGLLRQA